MPANVPNEPRVLAGKCECGAVRYRVADEFRYAANCHCSRCRAATGSAFKPFAGIEREKLELTRGADALLVHGEESLNDTRCAACGSKRAPAVSGLPVSRSGPLAFDIYVSPEETKESDLSPRPVTTSSNLTPVAR